MCRRLQRVLQLLMDERRRRSQRVVWGRGLPSEPVIGGVEAGVECLQVHVHLQLHRGISHQDTSPKRLLILIADSHLVGRLQ